MAQSALEGGQRLAAEGDRRERGQGGEADGVAAREGGEAEILRERGFADAARAAQEHVVAALDEVEGAVQLLVESRGRWRRGGSSRSGRGS